MRFCTKDFDISLFEDCSSSGTTIGGQDDDAECKEEGLELCQSTAPALMRRRAK